MSKIVSIVLATVFIISVFSAITQAALASTKTTPELSGTAAAVTVFTEGFEGAWPGPWVLGDSNAASGPDYWGDSNYRRLVGLWSGWCADYGWQSDTGYYNSYVHRYDDNMRGYMYRPVSLSGYTSVTLSYYYWINTEVNVDYLQVIYYAGGYWYYVDKHTGSSYGWYYSSVSIPTYATQVGFYFVSDYSLHNYEGAYIDQVVCTGYTPAPLYFADGFESGSFSKWSGTVKTYGETAYVIYGGTRHHGLRSARFTSNGGGGYEKSYCYKNIPVTSDIYVRGYFYISKSGIVQTGDRFFFIILKPVGATGAAYIGLKRNPANGIVSWCFNCRSGASYPQPDFYSTYLSPHVGHWYCVEIHWRMGVTNGYAQAWINGVYIGWTGYRNTAYYGSISQVQFGLPQLYSCASTTAYADCARISNTYIGPEY